MIVMVHKLKVLFYVQGVRIYGGRITSVVNKCADYLSPYVWYDVRGGSRYYY